MPLKPVFSILIPTSGRPEHLRGCVESIFNGGHRDLEVLVLVNESCWKSVDYLRKASGGYTGLKYFVVKERLSHGAARNRLVDKSSGDLLYFIDDDVVQYGNALTILEDKFREYPWADVIGGPNLTPESSSRLQKYFGFFFESYFGSSGMRYRYKPIGCDVEADEKKLILCNLAFRSRVFNEMGLRFNEEIPSNEENILLEQLKSKGGRMLYVPSLRVYHHRRDSLIGFCRQLFKYGRGRAQSIAHNPRTFDPVFILPSALLAYIIISLPASGILFRMPLAAYLLADVAASLIKSVGERDLTAVPALMVIFPLGHLSYGMGFIFQLVKTALSWKAIHSGGYGGRRQR
ncbi:MAG: glycosyltransferase [Candidatus Altiarchaeota archaeon]